MKSAGRRTMQQVLDLRSDEVPGPRCSHVANFLPFAATTIGVIHGIAAIDADQQRSGLPDVIARRRNAPGMSYVPLTFSQDASSAC